MILLKAAERRTEYQNSEVQKSNKNNKSNKNWGQKPHTKDVDPKDSDSVMKFFNTINPKVVADT